MPEGPLVPDLPPPPPPATAADVARWMLAELTRRHGFLSEPTAALEIVRLFGGDFTTLTPSGSFTIGRAVLDAFDRASILSDREVVWSDVERGWRLADRRPNPYR
jgi:hypothetical protein